MEALTTAKFEVPDRYHKDLLHLMAVSADSLYVYWEISDRRRWLLSQHFECDYSAMPKVIRLYDVTHIYFDGGNAHAYWDVVTTPEATNWYLHRLRANRTYLADMGTYTWEHEFIPLLRSNCIVTPRASEAVWGEPLQTVVPEAQTDQVDQRIRPSFFENIQTYTPYMR